MAKILVLEKTRSVEERRRRYVILSWSITFLVIGLIAAFWDLAASPASSALFLFLLVPFLVGLVMGRRPPVYSKHVTKRGGISRHGLTSSLPVY